MEKIESNRLILRYIELKDKNAMFAYRSDPEVYKYQYWKPTTVDDVIEFITTEIVREPNIPGTWLQFGIWKKEDVKLIGDCGIHFLENEFEQVEIGITISRDYQGKGYGKEALSILFNYVFHSLGKHRIIASIDPANIASITLMEKMRMRKEAHFIKSISINNKWVDDVIYAILKEEWNQYN